MRTEPNISRTLSLDVFDPVTRTESCLPIDEMPELFRRDGLLVLPEFFSAQEMEAVNRELDAHFAPLEATALDQARACRELRKFNCDVIAWDPVSEGNQVMIALKNHPRLAAMTEKVLGPGYTGPNGLVMYSVPGGHGQAWHQDCPSVDSTAFNLNRLIYTSDISMQDGAIICVPGSHMKGSIPPPGGHQEPIEGEVTLTPSAGTLVLLRGHVYHRVTPNLNTKPRNSVNFRAFPCGVSPEVNYVGVYRNGSVNFCDVSRDHDGTPSEI